MDLKSCTFQHHCHKVFTNIMKVALNGSDNSFSHRLISDFYQLRLQN